MGEVYVTNMVGLNAGSDSIKLGWGTTSRRMYNMRWENIDVVNYCPEGCGTPSARVRGGRIIGFDLYITHRLNPSVVSNVYVQPPRTRLQLLSLSSVLPSPVLLQVLCGHLLRAAADARLRTQRLCRHLGRPLREHPRRARRLRLLQVSMATLFQ